MQRVLIILFSLTVFFLAFLPIRDTDFGWHYRCGEELITQGKLCISNDYSYFLPDYKAYYPSFLFDALNAFVYDHSGFIGLSTIGGLVIVLAGLLFLSISRGSLIVRMSMFMVVYILSSVVFNLGLRSQIFSYTFVLSTIWLLEKSQKNDRYLFVIPVLFFVWVNTHIGFFTGLFVLGAFTFERLMRDGVRSRTALKYSMVIGISIIATLLNPFGWKVYVEIARHIQSPLGSMIAEWVPSDIVTSSLMCIAAVILMSGMIYKRNIRVFSLLLLIFFLILAVTSRRSIPFFLTILSIEFLHLISKWQLSLPPEITIPLLGAIAICIIIIQTPKTLELMNWNNYCIKGITHYPCEITGKKKALRGNIFANYEWGGFLVWQMPESRIFIDGRMPAWSNAAGVSPYKIYLSIIQTQTGWNEFLQEQKTDYILISPNTFLDVELASNGQRRGWIETFRNEYVVLYKQTYKR